MKPVSILLFLSLLFGGCSSAYYGTMEKMGFAKRDILVNRVEKAQDAQEEAKVQFTSALEAFLAVTKVDGGALKAKYDALNSQLKDCESRANELHRLRQGALRPVIRRLGFAFGEKPGLVEADENRRRLQQPRRGAPVEISPRRQWHRGDRAG